MKNAALIEVLSLGAGVQSTAVFLMSVRGLLPKLDAAIFADTGWEPESVYRNLAWLEKAGLEAGIPIHRVKTGNIRDDALVSQVRGKAEDGNRWASMPLFVLSPDGDKGQIRRQCTHEYKIRCIEKCLRRDILGLKPFERAPKVPAVRQWFGISSDESRRMRPDDSAWCKRWYPLCSWPTGHLGRTYTRQACKVWLDDNYPGREFPRSACVGCPYRSNDEWREIKKDPKAWTEAVELDEQVRDSGGARGQCFLHAERIPLKDVDLDTDYDKGQIPLWREECSGICGV